MRDWEDIWERKEVKEHNQWFHGYSGSIELSGCRSPIVFVASIDNGNEHVSVHFRGCVKKTPSWEDMCRIKDIFWDEEEEVHQIHPKRSEYIRKFGELENVLHLWRPVNGWEW